MARPRKQGLDYFPLDVDFFDDEKMVCISGEFGLKGEITVIRLLCAIYRNGYFAEWNDMMRFKLLRQLPGISADLLDQIVNRLVKWGFFDKALFDSDMILTSPGIQRRYFECKKRSRLGSDYSYLLINIADSGVNVTQTPVNVTLMPQSKVKESKVKKISTDVDTKKAPPSAVIEVENSASPDPIAKALAQIRTNAAAVARSLATDEQTLLAFADEVAEKWRLTSEYDAERPVNHMINTIAKKIAAAGVTESKAIAADKARTAREERRERERREREANIPVDAKASLQAYLRSKGLDPDANLAEIVAASEPDKFPFLNQNQHDNKSQRALRQGY